MDTHGAQKPRYVTFDAHVHVMTLDRLQSGWRWMRDHYQQPPAREAPSPESLAQEARDAGLLGFFNFFFPIVPSSSRQVNEWNDRFCSALPGALPFLSLHPEDSPRERTKLAEHFLLKRRFAGLKIHSYIQRLRLDAEWLPEILALLEQQKRLLIVHTGYSDIYRSKYREAEMADHLAGILENYPHLTVVAAHMLYPEFTMVSRLLESYPNLHLDHAGMHYWVRQDGRFEEWIAFCERYANRILFGSDSGFVKETLAQAIADFESSPLSENALRLIGGENALRLVASLGLARD